MCRGMRARKVRKLVKPGACGAGIAAWALFRWVFVKLAVPETVPETVPQTVHTQRAVRDGCVYEGLAG